MKSCFLLLPAAGAIILSACSPSTPASDATASVSETAAATVAADDDVTDTAGAVVTESEASSAATVVVTQAETYDPVVIREMGRKPGYWEVKHTDPKTNKSYVTHVCVDKPLAAKMANQGAIAAPADRRDYKTDASFRGDCPTGVKGGDVQRGDGNKVNAYGDRKPNPAHDNRQTDGKAAPDKDRKDQAHIQVPASATPSHNPHATPAGDHAGDKPVQPAEKGHDGDTRSRSDQNRG